MIRSLFAVLAFVFPITLLAQSSEEIVKRLSSIGEAAEAKLNAADPVISPPMNDVFKDWFRRKVTAEKITFDVRRTDSLVSPYVGDFQLTCTVKGTKGSKEEDVKDTPDSFSISAKCKAAYAFQSSKWALKSFQCQKSSSDPIFVDINASSSNKTQVACFSAFGSE
jgi:hypothetical protein